MLKQRMITGILLLILFFCAAVYSNSLVWTLFIAGISVLASREFFNLRPVKINLQIVYYFILFALFVFMALISDSKSHHIDLIFLKISFFLACIFWLWSLYCLFIKTATFSVNNNFMSVILAISWIFPFMISASLLRQKFGYQGLLLICSIAWLSDTGAYFVGRKYGKHKLAPSVSPNKSIEGLLAGLLITVLILCFLCYSVYSYSANWFLLVFIISLLSLLGVVGDLFESLLKREANVKDSGNILPGHGGVLDRLDSLLAIFPFGILLFFIVFGLGAYN